MLILPSNCNASMSLDLNCKPSIAIPTQSSHSRWLHRVAKATRSACRWWGRPAGAWAKCWACCREGRQAVFQAKSEVVEATAERLEMRRKFKLELEELLTATGETTRAEPHLMMFTG